MSPKSTPSKSDKISLFGRKFSLTQSVRWDREIICDYIADRIDAHGDNLCNAAEKLSAGSREAIFEVCAICSALRDHRNAGMSTEVSVNLDGIAGFVTWSKEELFQSLVRQVYLNATEFRTAEVSEPSEIAEVVNLCGEVLKADDPRCADEILEWRMSADEEEPTAAEKTA